MKFDYPLNTNSTQFTDWVKNLRDLVGVCLKSVDKDLEEAKSSFNRFTDFFPQVRNLNDIDSRQMFVGESTDKVWVVFSRLLHLWMDLQEESLPGVDERNAVNEQEFVNALRLAEHKLYDLLV